MTPARLRLYPMVRRWYLQHRDLTWRVILVVGCLLSVAVGFAIGGLLVWLVVG